MKILVADIGGTNCRFAKVQIVKPHEVAHAQNGGLGPHSERALLGEVSFTLGERCRLATSDYKDVYSLLEALASVEDACGTGFLPNARSPWAADMAVFAVAGPVRGDKAHTPNMNWDIDAAKCAKACGLSRVLLINDFVAQAFVALSPEVSKPKRILGPAIPNGSTLFASGEVSDPVAIVGAGTGLGMCLLLPPESGNTYGRKYLPSEGGHVSFAFESQEEWDFAEFMRQKRGKKRLIGDDVVSGPGLACLHSYFHGEDLTPAEVAARLYPESKVLEYFAAFYGRACRDYVLSTLALGGLGIAGGLAAKNPVLVAHPTFAQNFYNVEAHRTMLEGVPVWLHQEVDAGLWGAAIYALGLL